MTRRRAQQMRNRYMADARACRALYQNTRDPVYMDMVRILVQAARQLNRSAWRRQ